MGFEELGCPDTRVATAITTRTMERIIVLKYCVGWDLREMCVAAAKACGNEWEIEADSFFLLVSNV